MALTLDRLPLLIAIDGAADVGRSSLASGLAWQLGAAAIHLDLYAVRGSNPLQWRTEDLDRGVAARLEVGPAIVEGVLVLDALGCINRKPNFLVFVRGEGSDLQGQVGAYMARTNPRGRADFELTVLQSKPR